MEHIFVLKKSTFSLIQESPVDLIFKNYAEARKSAISIVKKEDLANNPSMNIDPESEPTTFYKEVSPDLWLNKFGLIKIDIIEVRRNDKKRKKSLKKAINQTNNTSIEVSEN